MKMYAISDLHGNLAGLDLQDADVVVIAGDVAPIKGWGVWHVNDQVKWMNQKFAAWCEQYPKAEFVVIPGNHDLFAQRDDVPTKLMLPRNVHFIVDDMIEVKGLRIAGSPWIPPISGRWAFETNDEAELARRFMWIPEGVDILITHTPPFVEGWNVDVSLQTKSPHFGSRALTAAIVRVKPKLVFCGHIHTGDHRIHELVHANGQITKIYNVSRLDEDYAVAFESQIAHVCRNEDLSELTIELDDDLVTEARKRFRRYGISLEQGASMFIEEFVRAKGDMAKSTSAAAERLQRIISLSPQFANCGQEQTGKGERS